MRTLRETLAFRRARERELLPSRPNYPSRHFFMVKLIGFPLMVILFGVFLITYHAAALIASGLTGVVMLLLLDERQ